MDVTGITLFPPRVLVLAAGAGSRMGGPKIFAEIHGKPFGFHVACTLAKLTWPATWVLKDASQISRVEAWPQAPGFSVAINPAGDMFSSVMAGLFSLRGWPPDSFCIWPIDFPCVHAETLLQLEKKLCEGFDAALPVDIPGHGGHPLCVRRHMLLRWVSALPTSGGLRAVMEALSCRMARVVITDRACFFNLNTPAEVQSFENGVDT